MRVLCILFNENQDLKKLAEVFYTLTPQIAIAGERVVYLEMSQVRQLYSEEIFIQQTKQILQNLNVKAQVRVAADPPTALAMQLYSEQKAQMPIEALKIYADPFLQDLDLQQKSAQIIKSLISLRVLNFEDFLKLPVKSLSSRYGSLGVYLHQAVQSYSKSWPRYVPEPQVFEKVEFAQDWQLSSSETLLFSLKSLLDRASLRLFARGQRLKRFTVILEQDRFSVVRDPLYKIEIYLSLPQASQKTILALTRERLEYCLQKNPLKTSVLAMTLNVDEVVPLGISQKDLFHPKREESEESYAQLVSRLALRLGEKSVFKAQARESYSPEKNWVISQNPENPCIQDPLPTRPLRVFKDPIPVLLHLSYIEYNGELKKIKSFEQKEVMLTDWWSGEGERIYFKVCLENHEQLWVYQMEQQFFLHGYFD